MTSPAPDEEAEEEIESPFMHTPLLSSIPLQSIFKQEHKTFVMRNRKTTFTSQKPRTGTVIRSPSVSTSEGLVATLKSFWAWCVAPQTPIESRYRDTYLDESLFSLAHELLDGNYWVRHSI
jgi:hypothetical protein